MSDHDWRDRPVLAQSRVLLRLDRALVSAAVYPGSNAYGEPLWRSHWTVGMRRRDYRDLEPGALWWVAYEGLRDREPLAFMTTKEWAEEMARIRRL